MELSLDALSAALVAALAAAALGSFLGTLGARLAADFKAGGDGRAFARMLGGRSVCLCGGRVLSVLEIAPLFGFLLRRGRCRVCAAPLPWMEPAAEGAALIGAGALLLAGASGLEAVLFGATAAAAVMLAWIDQEQGFLPDLLLILLAGLGLATAGLTSAGLTAGGGIGWDDRLLGVAAGAGLPLGLRWAWLRWRGVEAIGLGDVKLLAIAGFWVGVGDLPTLLAIGAAAAFVAAVGRRGFARDATAPLGPGVIASLLGVIAWRALLG